MKLTHLFSKSALLFVGLAVVSYSFILKSDDSGLKIQDSAPLADVKMANINNQLTSLNELKKEKGLLVVFSCNTCPFVVGSEHFEGWGKQYNALHELASTSGIGMVLVNSNEAKRGDEDSFEAMQKHAKKMKYTMPYVLDKGSMMADAFGAKTTPHVYLFDASMKLVYMGSVDNTWDPKRSEDIPYLKNALSNLSAGTSVVENTSAPRGCSIKRLQN